MTFIIFLVGVFVGSKFEKNNEFFRTPLYWLCMAILFFLFNLTKNKTVL